MSGPHQPADVAPDLAGAQSLVLRPPAGAGVVHLLLQVPEGGGGRALALLKNFMPSFGVQAASASTLKTVGFSCAGLQALGVPAAYLRLFGRLSPAFRDGALRRSPQRGDSAGWSKEGHCPDLESERAPVPQGSAGCSKDGQWSDLEPERAHVLLTWHGLPAVIGKEAQDFADQWVAGPWPPAAQPTRPVAKDGKRLTGPNGEPGHWVHFGFRDGISEVCIEPSKPGDTPPDTRLHRPGELLLGHINDAGANPFALSRAPEKVRAFFKDSSFGILRPMRQETAAFERQVEVWRGVLQRQYSEGKLPADVVVTRDFVKAKLCGRWPTGEVPHPGELTPSGSLVLAHELAGDARGEGCPFGSHVRRMRSPDGSPMPTFQRPLQRRSYPFGAASWGQVSEDRVPRGLIGHFFCSSIENQFEHLLGQWAARPPLGFALNDNAPDPLLGPHTDPGAALNLPLQGRPDKQLYGFGSWTTPLGTMYAWHPSKTALHALLEQDYKPDDEEGPWQ